MIALVTAFDPFGGHHLNASEAALRALPDRVRDVRICREILPTSFARAWPVLEAALERCKPDIVLLLGQAGGRAGISLERQAINIIEARLPDNDDMQPQLGPVLSDVDTAFYLTTLPINLIRKDLSGAGVTAHLSNDAGRFVCNATLFQFLHHLAKTQQQTDQVPPLAGFIHLPWLPEQIAESNAKPDDPSLPAEDAALGIRRIIEVCASIL